MLTLPCGFDADKDRQPRRAVLAGVVRTRVPGLPGFRERGNKIAEVSLGVRSVDQLAGIAEGPVKSRL